MILAFSRNIFETCTDMKTYENPFRGAELFHAYRQMEKTDGQTDRHDESDSHVRICANTHTSECYENNIGDGITQVAP
jgi:hypothetical protein